MNATDKIIKLIEKGDPALILSEEVLAKKLNELLKYRLIDITDNKIILTQKGKEARIMGMDKVISKLKNQEELKEFSVEIQK